MSNLGLGECWQETFSAAVRRKTELTRDLFNFLTVRADLSDKTALLADSALNVKAFEGDDAAFLELWLELSNGGSGGDLAQMESQIALRGLDLNAALLIDTPRIQIHNAGEAAQAIAQIDALHAKISYLATIRDQLERLHDDEPLSADYARELEGSFVSTIREKPLSHDDIAQAVRAVFQEEYNRDLFFLRTGFGLFDGTFGGLRREEVTVIGARPGDGKTMLAVNFLLQFLQLYPNKKAMFFSLELPKKDILRRLLVAIANPQPPSADPDIMYPNLLYNDFKNLGSDYVMGKFAQAANALNDLIHDRLVIIDQDPETISDIETEVQLAMYDFKPDLVLVDYWQLITGGCGQNLREKLVNVSQRLKRIAKFHKISVVCCAQLRRQQANGDEIIHPDLSSIAESDQLGRDAALVALISSMKTAGPDGQPQIFRGLEVVKNRHGRTGILHLTMAGAAGRFYEQELVDSWPPQYRQPKADKKAGYGREIVRRPSLGTNIGVSSVSDN